MCSASCGGGSRARAIFCTEENGNETTKVNKGWNGDNLNTRNPFILNSGISTRIPTQFPSVKNTLHARQRIPAEKPPRELRALPFYYIAQGGFDSVSQRIALGLLLVTDTFEMRSRSAITIM